MAGPEQEAIPPDELAPRRARRAATTRTRSLEELLAAAGTADGHPAGTNQRRRALLEADDDCDALAALTDRTLDRLDAERPTRSMALRAGLGVVSVIQLVLSVPWLVGSNPWTAFLGQVPDSHLTRDGAIGVVTATAGLVTVWRSRYAFAMLAIAAVGLVMQVLGGAVDADVGTSFEAVHVVALVIAVLVLTIAARRDRPVGARGDHRI